MLRSVLPRWRRVLLVAPCLPLVVGVLPSTALAQTEPAGEWIPPVGGPVVRPFVAPIAVYAAGHRGVDFAAAPGTPVRAANDGTVSFAGDVAGSLHVVVAHAGGIRTTYAFLLSADVRTGDAVRRGQVIGGAGGSGEAHEPSVLHFGVRVGDRYVDPMLLFRPRDLTQIVRLVPVGEREAAEHPDPRDERRELQAWIESQFDGCALCGAPDWVAERGGGGSGRWHRPAAGGGGAGSCRGSDRRRGAGGDPRRGPRGGRARRAKRCSRHPQGWRSRDVIVGGATFLGWFFRDCDEHAPPANGAGGSDNAVLAVGGVDSHRERGDDRSFDFAAGRLGYDRSERFWFSYRKGSKEYTKQDTYGDLRRKARMLGAQLRRAARTQPGRAFDLVGHSQGGVVIALFLATVYRGHEAEYPPIDHVVTFASPLKGTPAASSGEGVAASPVGRALMEGLGAADLPIPDPLATSIRQLAEGSDVIDDIAEAGIPEGIDFTSIAGVEDGHVPVRSTELEGTRRYAVDVGHLLSSHSEITRHPRALMAAACRARGPHAPVHVVRRERQGIARLDASLVGGASRRAAGRHVSSRVLRCVALVAMLCIAHGRPSPASGADAEPWEGTWSTPGPALASVLAVDELGTVAAGNDGDVRALDPSGAPIWRSRVDGGDVGNEPALLADLAVVASADRITALERSSGAARWQHRARGGRVAVGALPDGTDVVLVSTARGELALLDAASGALRRTMRLPGSEPSSAPYVWLSGAHGVAAWSTHGTCCTLAAVDLEDGRMSWSRSVTHHSSVPVVHRGLVIVGTSPRGPRSARVAARDVATGAVKWTTPVVGRFGPSLFGDAAGTDVVIANRAGSVLSLDVGSGSLHWTSDPVEASDEAHPKIAGTRVFLTPLSAGAVEIDRSSGAVLQSGPFTPEVYVHASAGTADRFEVLVGNGFESAVWAFEPSPIH